MLAWLDRVAIVIQVEIGLMFRHQCTAGCERRPLQLDQASFRPKWRALQHSQAQAVPEQGILQLAWARSRQDKSLESLSQAMSQRPGLCSALIGTHTKKGAHSPSMWWCRYSQEKHAAAPWSYFSAGGQKLTLPPCEQNKKLLWFVH